MWNVRFYKTEVFVNFLAMISLKKKIMEHCVDLILISLKNTKIGWNM